MEEMPAVQAGRLTDVYELVAASPGRINNRIIHIIGDRHRTCRYGGGQLL